MFKPSYRKLAFALIFFPQCFAITHNLALRYNFQELSIFPLLQKSQCQLAIEM